MTKPKSQKIETKIIILFFVVLLFFYFFYRDVKKSILIKSNGKINVVFYGSTTRVFSLDNGGTNYIISIPSQAKLLIPGGYGLYKTGSLGKLVSLEKKPDLYIRSFSAALSAFVNIYFYPYKNPIYYDDQKGEYLIPSFREIFLGNSNASFIDRLILYSKTFNKNQNAFKIIEESERFEREKFNSRYLGIFYKQSYREIGEKVQISYSKSYKTAELISDMIEGEGIRVVDIDEKNGPIMKKCLLTARAEAKNSPTLMVLADFFGCNIKVGQPAVSDIILELGPLEEIWAFE